jgi:hypothetical protein
MIFNAQANEIKITPTSIDKVGPYVVKIVLNDAFNAKTSYQFIFDLFDHKSNQDFQTTFVRLKIVKVTNQ